MGERLVLTTASGFGAIYESGVLTETHTIYVKAFDRAGNETKSEPVRILIMHEPKEEKTGALWPSSPVAILTSTREPGSRQQTSGGRQQPARITHHERESPDT